MDVIKHKTDSELIRSLLAEAAKCKNEIACSKSDIQKAQNRLSFILLVINELLDRSEDQEIDR